MKAKDPTISDDMIVLLEKWFWIELLLHKNLKDSFCKRLFCTNKHIYRQIKVFTYIFRHYRSLFGQIFLLDDDD